MALILLAVVTGATDEAAPFFKRLDAWLDKEQDPERSYAWVDVIGGLQGANGAGEDAAREDAADDADEDPLQELLDDLGRIVQGSASAPGFQRRCTPAQLRQWAERTARFSVSIRLQLV